MVPRERATVKSDWHVDLNEKVDSEHVHNIAVHLMFKYFIFDSVMHLNACAARI